MWLPATERNYFSFIIPPSAVRERLPRRHNCRDLWAAGREPSEVLVWIPGWCSFCAHTSNFNTVRVLVWKGTCNHAGLCVGCHGYAERWVRSVWSGCRAAEFCLPLISAREGVEGGRSGDLGLRSGGFPCGALIWEQGAGMGIHCCTSFMSNIFRKETQPSSLFFFFCIQNLLLKMWLTISCGALLARLRFTADWPISPWKMALCLGWQGRGGRGSYAQFDYKNK